MLLIQGLGKHLLPTWAKQPDREEDEPRGPPRHPYPHYEHHENHDNEGMPDRASDTTAAEQAKEEEEVTNMAQTAMTLILSLPGARSFEEAFQGEIAPDWYWELVDAGGDLCRGGAKVDVIATKFGEAVLRRRENDMASYLTTEPIRNRLLRAWEIVCAHYQSVEVPLPVGFDVGPFAHNAEEIIHRHRGATVDRDQEEATSSSSSDRARSRTPPRDQVPPVQPHEGMREHRGPATTSSSSTTVKVPPRDPSPEVQHADLHGNDHERSAQETGLHTTNKPRSLQ